MQAEEVDGEIISARRDYLRQQERERKRRQRARQRDRTADAGPASNVPVVTLEAIPFGQDETATVGIDPPRPMGKPKRWPPDKALKWQDFICSRIRAGKTLTAILRKHPAGPSLDTVYRWLGESATFATAYERAKVDAADSFFYQAIDIADASRGDAAAISAARLRVDTRKYAAAKLKPERYADRSEVAHTGNVQHVITDDQRARALAAFIARQAIGAAQSLPEVRKLIDARVEKDQPEETAQAEKTGPPDVASMGPLSHKG